jgi:hypothetical protein
MFKLSVDVREDPRMIAFLKGLPRGVVRVALPAIAEWYIGTGQRGLKRYSPYKYVSRRRAYGKPFKSDKQRRFVMAMIREGRIDPGVPHRTGNTQRGYHMVSTNRGYTVKIVNRTRGAVYTRHNVLQARLNRLAGWRKTALVIASNTLGAMRHARAAVRVYLRKRKSS